MKVRNLIIRLSNPEYVDACRWLEGAVADDKRDKAGRILLERMRAIRDGGILEGDPVEIAETTPGAITEDKPEVPIRK